jgi:hypothetical protein
MKTKKEILTEKLNAKLSDRRTDILDAMKHIETSGEMLNDFIVPSKKLMFGNGSDNIVRMGFGENSVKLHPNAVSQLAGRFNVNARDLQREINGSDWERQVFVNRMQAYADRSRKQNLLIRKVDDTAKGILSDRYRRLNTAGIFLAFLQAAVEAGSVLVDANHGELRDFLEVIHPAIVEIPTEKNGTIHTVFGAQIRNSDFGASKLELRIYQMNVVCLNGMVSNSMITEKHLGSRIEESNTITFESDTYEADTKARALQVRDIMKSVYSEENLKRERERIIDATEVELDFSHEIKALPKMGVLQGEVEMLNKALYESDPENGLQGKNTLWKLAQGLTHVANEVESKDRRRDLQDIASQMVSNFVK